MNDFVFSTMTSCRKANLQISQRYDFHWTTVMQLKNILLLAKDSLTITLKHYCLDIYTS